MQHKVIEFAEKLDGNKTAIFYAVKLHKHVSINNHTQTGCSVGRPGDVLVLDSFFVPMVFDRKTFQKCFGHKRMELLDE